MHELAKRAKDMGSAAVLFSLINAALIWACIPGRNPLKLLVSLWSA